MTVYLWLGAILALSGTVVTSYWRFAEPAPAWSGWIGSVVFLVGMGLLLHRRFKGQARPEPVRFK